ncbi:hypothetical protein [Rathayibacter toxicus]|uniref:Uncharacterized protein n=2 Tax=Rathayibacter toxicus TaxID=145458 RepID=A0A2S5Y4N1_9MICO|nr:hypothetical protein [Rathayibacter toxicus]PPH21223.1 hypothetical protein C5D17_10355 [Rathayibacter toxicus]PPH56339.1 hypothetical protein C5D30_10345 [Rathayibacter toxicus]PPH58435.1 hypothetical protein C5C93_10405 [Rathayibacter toxicus]PPH86180.1 hypothetical protein C5D31_10380 [Rathayibacter toxicus]PPI13512.1 hypothetical protein C5C51_10335 [Rathayibacter toxicus]
MTKHQKPRNISIDDGWTIEVPSENGVERRTLVKGAAWSVPIIATAGATPAFAASPTPTLAFTQSSYSGTGCGTITGVQVKRTVDGTAPDPGKTVTVTLANGYTFANGTTTYSGTTDANGLITLPDIKVPAQGGNSTFSASSDSLAATAPVSATAGPGGQSFSSQSGATPKNYPKMPADAVAVGYGYFLTPGGDLWYYTQSSALATGVTSAVAQHIENPVADTVFYTTKTSSFSSQSGATPIEYKNIPAGSTSVGYGYFLTSDGDLWYYSQKTALATGVTSAVAQHIENPVADTVFYTAVPACS